MKFFNALVNSRAMHNFITDVKNGNIGHAYMLITPDKDVVEDIVANLRKQMATLDDTQYEIIENEIPEASFRLLLLSISLMLLCAFILKV